MANFVEKKKVDMTVFQNLMDVIRKIICYSSRHSNVFELKLFFIKHQKHLTWDIRYILELPRMVFIHKKKNVKVIKSYCYEIIYSPHTT